MGALARHQHAAARLGIVAGALLLVGLLMPALPRTARAAPSLPPVLSILPPGENGLVNPAQALVAQLPAPLGQRPPNSNDQTAPYAGLLYAPPGLTDQALTGYFNAETLGTRRTSVASRRCTPRP